MSDLQCPATILLAAPESITSHGARAIIGTKRLSEVFVAPSVAANPSGSAAARELADRSGGPLSTMAGIVDGASLRAAMDALADLHRGETIALVAPKTVIEDAVGIAQEGPIVVAIDSDGWSVLPQGMA